MRSHAVARPGAGSCLPSRAPTPRRIPTARQIKIIPTAPGRDQGAARVGERDADGDGGRRGSTEDAASDEPGGGPFGAMERTRVRSAGSGKRLVSRRGTGRRRGRQRRTHEAACPMARPDGTRFASSIRHTRASSRISRVPSEHRGDAVPALGPDGSRSRTRRRTSRRMSRATAWRDRDGGSSGCADRRWATAPTGEGAKAQRGRRLTVFHSSDGTPSPPVP
ncbi:hypothetical protein CAUPRSCDRAFT_12058 [Caulochytrium protostelioides]|uniref:Uncharacterized protein n=1 Tax=Caulochytrium protostelioides TaxID=1555241 RepID=A0A4P9WSP5_9FUNG|nr:hypothetical protein CAUPRSCDRAFT_12058 [Caulochytrium protostelioides]